MLWKLVSHEQSPTMRSFPTPQLANPVPAYQWAWYCRKSQKLQIVRRLAEPELAQKPLDVCILPVSSEPSSHGQSKLNQRKSLLCLLCGPVSVTISFGNNLPWECYKYHLSDGIPRNGFMVARHWALWQRCQIQSCLHKMPTQRTHKSHGAPSCHSSTDAHC